MGTVGSKGRTCLCRTLVESWTVCAPSWGFLLRQRRRRTWEKEHSLTTWRWTTWLTTLLTLSWTSRSLLSWEKVGMRAGEREKDWNIERDAVVGFFPFHRDVSQNFQERLETGRTNSLWIRMNSLMNTIRREWQKQILNFAPLYKTGSCLYNSKCWKYI